MAGVAAWLFVIAFTSVFLCNGAALHISLVEHPARLKLPTRAAAQSFRTSYPRAVTFQPAYYASALWRLRYDTAQQQPLWSFTLSHCNVRT